MGIFYPIPLSDITAAIKIRENDKITKAIIKTYISSTFCFFVSFKECPTRD